MCNKNGYDGRRKGFVFLCTFTGFTVPYDNLQAWDHGMGWAFPLMIR